MSDIFSGIGDLIGGIESSKGYFAAAKIERQNAQLEKEAGNINLLRQQRTAFQSFGTTTADLAGSGVRSDTAGALNLLREAHSNAALDSSLVTLQTQINVNADEAKAAEYSAQGQAAQSGGIFGFLSGAISTVASLGAFA